MSDETRTPSSSATPWFGTAGRKLFGYSFLILFFELALIRYLPGYVRVFGFYLNLVLLATFVGMGVGLLRARVAGRVRWLGPAVMLALLATVWIFADTVVTPPVDANEYLWAVPAQGAGVSRRLGILPTITILFTLCALFFVPLGALMGREFRKFPPLVAYSLDVGGSLAGILAFGLLSALATEPATWFAVGGTVWVLLALPDRPFAVAVGLGCLAAVGIALATAGPQPEYWSPYYRINVSRMNERVYQLTVNGSLHQLMLDFRPQALEESEYIRAVRADYLAPYVFLRNVDTALVVGSGTGNDVALLLGAGVSHVDAVEIDPTILQIGVAANAQDPYGDPRVQVFTTDARAYLDRTDRKYDLIVFGTLDSQTLLSGMTSLRLDNYVYTREAFAAARSRLDSGGSLVAYHMSAQPYIGAKIYGLLAEAFGAPPAVRFEADHRLFNYTFVAGAAAGRASGWQPPADIVGTGVTLPSDDWPYLYLQRPTMPYHYVKALAMVLTVALVMVLLGHGAIRARGVRFDWPLFFMGAGFLLVETKSVSELALLFGATWAVNLVVFFAVLTMILAANIWMLQRPPASTRWPFVGLFVSLAAAYAVPARDLLPLGLTGSWIMGGLLVALPILFAAVIFALLFRNRTAAPTAALAANLFGAIVGGVLEYSAMIVGIKALYLLAAGCYVAVVYTTWKRSEAAAAA